MKERLHFLDLLVLAVAEELCVDEEQKNEGRSKEIIYSHDSHTNDGSNHTSREA